MFTFPACHFSAARQSTLLTGLSAYWKMDESSGNRVDEIGSLALAVSGTVDSGAGRVYGRNSLTTAARFAGIGGTANSYLSTASDAALSFGDNSWTACCWCMARNANQTPMVFRKENEYSLLWQNSSGKFLFGLWAGATFTGVTSTELISRYKWDFVEVFFNAPSNQVGIRVNNGAAATASFTGTPNTNSNTFYVGCVTGSSNFLQGAVQELGFWDRLLTDDERNELWNGGLGNLYPFGSTDSAAISGATSLLVTNALSRDDKTATFSDTPNGSYSADQIITSRTISGTKYQVLAFWNNAGLLTFGKRADSGAGFGSWSYYTTAIAVTADFDNHETISIAIDSTGIVHVCYDNRNDALRYRRSDASVATWAGGLTSGLAFTSSNEAEVTYAILFEDSAGEIYVTYRDGGAGDGDQYLKKYNTGTSTWADATGTTAGLIMDGQSHTPDWSPYLYRAPEIDSTGLMHFVWTWRQEGPTASDENVSHARYNPSTGAWTTLGGTSLTAPFNPPGESGHDDSKIFTILGTNQGVEPADVALDSNDVPHICSFGAEGAGTTQLYHYWHNGTSWTKNTITSRTGTFTDDLLRPIIFMTPDDKAVIVCSDAETYDDKKLRFIYSDSPHTAWSARVIEPIAISDGSDGMAGPCYGYDRQRLANDGVLDLLWFAALPTNADCPLMLTTHTDIDALLD